MSAYARCSYTETNIHIYERLCVQWQMTQRLGKISSNMLIFSEDGKINYKASLFLCHRFECFQFFPASISKNNFHENLFKQH